MNQAAFETLQRAQIVPYLYPDGERTVAQHIEILGEKGHLEHEGLKMKDNTLHVLMYALDVMGCGYYRCYQPARVVNALDAGIVVYPTNIPTDELLSWADIIVWERSATEAAARQIRILRDQRINVFDIDDDLFRVPAHNPVAPTVNSEGHQKLLAKVMGCCHHALTPNGVLGNMVRERCKMSASVLPNMVHFPDFIQAENTTGKVRIGWTGGNSHVRDLELVVPAMRDILKRFDNVTFVVLGFDGKAAGADLFKDMDVEYHPFVPPHKYAAKLGSLALDIGLAPLEDTKFNAMKSPLKYEEYSALGIPTIASPVGPYTIIRDGENVGLLASSQGDFYRKIVRLIRVPGLRKNMGANAKEFVYKNFSTDAVGPYYVQTFQALWERSKGVINRKPK